MTLKKNILEHYKSVVVVHNQHLYVPIVCSLAKRKTVISAEMQRTFQLSKD